MQIQLKQVEIIAALKAYITGKGFDLVGKTTDISFTAGRKDAGLTADISIEDTQIPGTETADASEDKATGNTSVVQPALAMVHKVKAAEVAVAAIATPATEAARAAPVAEAGAAVDAPKGPSLFG